MIQEKDFLYRVPVKNALVTAPGKQVRNPEILVDLEGGEFMHGNILDANSTNKLIDQSVKDAIDNNIENGNYVTKDLLETALNQAITEKADASALANEVSRATGAESGLQAAIATKADATALSNYVLTTALNQQVDTLNTAISAKYALKSELPTVPTKTSQLTNDSNFITAAYADSRYALSATADSLSVGLSKKQNKIIVNDVDVTDIETADITKLRTIVTNLINALSSSELIRKTSTLE